MTLNCRDTLIIPRGAHHPCVDVLYLEGINADDTGWTETVATASDAEGHSARLRVTKETTLDDVRRWLAAVPGSEPGSCSSLDAEDVFKVLQASRVGDAADADDLRASTVVEYSLPRSGLPQSIVRLAKPIGKGATVISAWLAGVWLIRKRVDKVNARAKLVEDAEREEADRVDRVRVATLNRSAQNPSRRVG